MTVIQRCRYITVRDNGTAGFLAEANYTDTLTDQTLTLEIERRSLLIKNAQLEVRRDYTGLVSAPITALVGIPAYFGSGKQLRQALAAQPVLLDMVTQAVTAVIQAEAFFYQERGFASATEYEDFWDDKYKNACVYYSNLDQVEHRFMDYIKDYYQGSNLFHRFLVTALEYLDDKPEIRSHLMDSFHEMSLTLKLDENLQIKKVFGKILRCPDSVCRRALDSLDSLRGNRLTSTGLNLYYKSCDKATTCTHMNHLLKEMVDTINLYQTTAKERC